MRLIPKSLLVLFVTLASCSSGNAYYYVEHTHMVDIAGKHSVEMSEPELIQARNDYEAYCEAFKKFVLAREKSRERMRTSGDMKHAPMLLLFTLQNTDSVEVMESVLGNNPKLAKDSLNNVLISQAKIN